MIWATVSSWSCFGWPYRASPSLAAKNIINLISVLTIWWCPCVEFIFWGSKITADGDCSHEIKRRLLLGRKIMTNLDSILKSRNITFPTKVHLVKAMVFPVVIYGYEGWTVKKAERQRIDAFELWCWEKTLESPLDCQEIQPVHSKGDQFWVFIGRTDVEPETSILWPPDAMSWLIGKDPDAGKDWGQEEKGMTEDEMVAWDVGMRWMASLTQRTWVWVNSGSWWWTGRAWCAVVHRVTKSQIQLNDWTELKLIFSLRQSRHSQLKVFTSPLTT